MIRYRLQCANAHDFEGWFASSAAFESEVAGGRLTCPACGSSEVDRALMAPAIARGGGRREAAPAPADSPAAPAGEGPGPVAAGDPRAAALLGLMRAVRRHVQETGVDVGRAFPEEARRIHYGEAEARPIYGQAEAEEARALIEEGVEILPLPVLPEDRN